MLRQLKRTALRTAATTAGLGVALEVTTHLPTEGRSSAVYHAAADGVVLPLIRLCLDPEAAHHLALEAVRAGWAPTHRSRSGGGVGRGDANDGWRVRMDSAPFGSGGGDGDGDGRGRRHRRPLVFPNPVGLAAGFDKDGVAVGGLLDVGFGFVEVGSVTPLPQPGNPRPRMFRLTEDRAVINRYGFNSTGLDAVEHNLREFVEQRDAAARNENELTAFGGSSSGSSSRPSLAVLWKQITADEADEEDDNTRKALQVAKTLASYAISLVPMPSLNRRPKSTTTSGLLGVNLGKNKTSTDEVDDYTRGIRQLGPYADYLVVNISSPNTPGLRGLQRREPLRRLLDATVAERNALLPPTTKSGVPLLLVKIAPDVTDRELEDIAAVVQEAGVDGVIVSNTSTSRPTSLISSHKAEAGGLSGAPIRQMSTECIRKLYALTDGNVPIIGVGGVGSGHDAYEKLKAGASLVEIYSMMVYEGPGCVSRIRSELADLMVQNGHRRLEDVVGLDHEDIYWRKRQERMKAARSVETIIVDE